MRLVTLIRKFNNLARAEGIRVAISTFFQWISQWLKRKFVCQDYNRMLDEYLADCRRRNGDAPRGIAIKLIWWNLKTLVKQHPAQKQKCQKMHNINGEDTSKSVRLAFVPEGAYGDHLIFANWLQYFMERYQTPLICIDVYCASASIKSIFNYDIPNLTVVFEKIAPKPKDYDAIFSFNRFPEIRYFRHGKISQLAPNLLHYIYQCESFMKENLHYFEHKPLHDGWSAAAGIVSGIKRIQQPDIYGVLGITEEYKYQIKVQEDEASYLAKLNLQPGEFITVHRGWDGAYPTNIKAWSLTSCGDLIHKLKITFPEKKIVVFGSERHQAPDTSDADLDLIGETTLEQVKVLLKNAAVHIDNEGGMVHLRHAVHGGPSVVMFGPTSSEFFGYSENKNIRSDICRQWCEWLTAEWPAKCAKTREVGPTPCMDGIYSSDVVVHIKELLG